VGVILLKHRKGTRQILFAAVLAFAAASFAPSGASAAKTDRTAEGEYVVPEAFAAIPAATRPAGLPADDRARGLVWTGLAPGAASGPCAGAFAVTTRQGVECSHGPDQPPTGLEVGTPQPVAASTATSTVSPQCMGTGTDGNRVQAVYVRAADVPDRYDAVASAIRGYAAAVDQVFIDSAAETGGARQVRWVTDSSCNLVIDRVQLTATGDDTLSNTMSELQAIGFNRTDRKYLLWTDATVYCGIGTIRGDDQPGSANLNNAGPSYARVDSGCWGLSSPIEAHELMHGLGGVQWTAPHRSMYGHCSDDWDRMCYQDDASVVMTYSCDIAHERLFDCNHDDYFHTAPAAGSYLATHWNTANSSFLLDPNAPPPSSTTTSTSISTTTSTPTTSTTVAPKRSTATFTGSLSRKQPSKVVSLTTGAGVMTATLTFTKATAMTIAILAPDGSPLAQRTGSGALSVSAQVPAGSNRVSVSSGGAAATYTLVVDHAA
jgi:hypothetical protein